MFMYLPSDKSGSIFIIGNSEEQYEISHLVTKDDVVVRFNNPNSSSSLKADVLFIANSPNMVIGKDIIDDTLLKYNALIVWRYSLLDMIFSHYQAVSLSKKIKYGLLFNLFKKKNKLDSYKQQYFPRYLQKDCTETLRCMASTGFLAIYLYLNLYPERKIYLHNFTFSGWSGHCWEREKEYVGALIKSGKLNLL